jgi:hypothetical protein
MCCSAVTDIPAQHVWDQGRRWRAGYVGCKAMLECTLRDAVDLARVIESGDDEGQTVDHGCRPLETASFFAGNVLRVQKRIVVDG